MMSGKRKMNPLLSPKESTACTWLEYRFLSMFHLIISDVREPMWQEFVRNQLTEHRIAAIREEMFNLTITCIHRKGHFEEKLFEFSSLCVRTAWLRLFDWAFFRLDPYWKYDVTRRRATHLIIDVKPQPPPIDSWTCGKVLGIFVQKCSLPTLFSPSPVINAMRSTLSDHEKSRTIQQQQAAKSKNIQTKEFKERKRSMSQRRKAKTTTNVPSESIKFNMMTRHRENKTTDDI